MSFSLSHKIRLFRLVFVFVLYYEDQWLKFKVRVLSALRQIEVEKDNLFLLTTTQQQTTKTKQPRFEHRLTNKPTEEKEKHKQIRAERRIL